MGQKHYAIKSYRKKPSTILNPVIHNVGSQALDQLSTKIRPKKNYKTNRKDLDCGALDIHKQIGKLPRPAGGWTLPDHKYTGPYNDLENQVRYNPETGEILEIYDQPTGPTAVSYTHLTLPTSDLV